MALTNKLQTIGNAVRSKTGGSSLLTLDQIVAAIMTLKNPTGSKSIVENGNAIDVADYATVDVNVPTGGGGIDGIIDATITDISSSTTKVRPYAFAYLRAITRLSLPNAVEGTTANDRPTSCCAYSGPSSGGKATFLLPSLDPYTSSTYNGNNEGRLFEAVYAEYVDLSGCVYVPTRCFTFSHIKYINLASTDYIAKLCFYASGGLDGGMYISFVSPGRTTVPAIQSDSFNSVSVNYRVYINDDLVDTMKASTNWSVIADHIYGESDMPANLHTLLGLD